MAEDIDKLIERWNRSWDSLETREAGNALASALRQTQQALQWIEAEPENQVKVLMWARAGLGIK
jgi:hypothetical protein